MKKKIDEKDIVEFICIPVREVCANDNFRIYGVEVDRAKYPDIEINKYGNVSICGMLHELGKGVPYTVKAVPENGNYGVSYKVVNIRRDRPTTQSATFNFLKEILTEAQTREVMREYPNIIDKVINNDLDDIDLSKLFNIGKARFEVIKNKIIENFGLVELIDKFQGILSYAMLRRLYDAYPSTQLIENAIKEDPYKCLCSINRVGFKTADGILAEIDKKSKELVKNGEEPIINFDYDLLTSEQRCGACVRYLLEENENSGHTCIGLKELQAQCNKLAPACSHHFKSVLLNKESGLHIDKASLSVSNINTFEMEIFIAETVLKSLLHTKEEKALTQSEPNYKSRIVWDIDYQKYISESNLTEEQGKALEYMCKYGFFILNGYGGSGKSYTASTVLKMCRDNGKSVMLLAPTGRASKILSDYAKYPASTIHRGLSYMPPDWQFNENNKLVCDIIILDETSMVDVYLFEKVLKAIDITKTKIMLIGDSAQLPSVGCGNVLHDLIESKIVPVATLTKIFRYGEGGVLTVATKIRNQKRFADNNVTPTVIGEDKGYVFIPTPQEEILKRVKVLYRKLIDSGMKPEDIMVLSSYNVGEYGTMALNCVTQPIANPNYKSDESIKVDDTTYYIGELVMQTVNNYKASLFSNPEIKTFVPNGEIGIITEILSDKAVVITFDNVKVLYIKDEMRKLKLAYSIGIHKSQGGSAEVVIMVTPKAHTFMLNSNLMYVGVTRARKKCYHLGELNTVNNALTKKENFNRKTMLGNLISANNKK